MFRGPFPGLYSEGAADMRIHHKLLGWLILLPPVMFSASLNATPLITFSCWVPTGAPLYERAETLFREAFEELGYDFAMHYRPNQRSLMEANAGTTDGDCARPHSYPKLDPRTELVKVDALLAQTSVEAWSHKKALSLASIEELQQAPYRIGYERGDMAVQSLVDYYELPHLIQVPSTASGLKMLSAKRIDLFIGTSISIRQELEHLEPTLPRALHSVGHLKEIQGHPYLHRKHRHLAPALARALRKRLPEEGWRLD